MSLFFLICVPYVEVSVINLNWRVCDVVRCIFGWNAQLCKSSILLLCFLCICGRSFCIWNIYWDFISKKCGFI